MTKVSKCCNSEWRTAYSRFEHKLINWCNKCGNACEVIETLEEPYNANKAHALAEQAKDKVEDMEKIYFVSEHRPMASNKEFFMADCGARIGDGKHYFIGAKENLLDAKKFAHTVVDLLNEQPSLQKTIEELIEEKRLLQSKFENTHEAYQAVFKQVSTVNNNYSMVKADNDRLIEVIRLYNESAILMDKCLENKGDQSDIDKAQVMLATAHETLIKLKGK